MAKTELTVTEVVPEGDQAIRGQQVQSLVEAYLRRKRDGEAQDSPGGEDA